MNQQQLNGNEVFLPGFLPRTSCCSREKPISGDLDPDQHFADVFDGSPRTTLFRQPVRSPFASLFYERIFWLHEVSQAVEMLGRRLPEFKIPVRSNSENERSNSRIDGFYNDTLIGVRRSYNSPVKIEFTDENDVSTFAPKLRRALLI